MIASCPLRAIRVSAPLDPNQRVDYLSVLENMEMAVLPHYSGNGFIQQKALRALCEDMCKKLLANTVIENYRIERP